jgi:membrane protein
VAVDHTSDDAAGRGRAARDPRQIPAPGWKDVLWRTYQGINDKNLFLVAGGVTYYVLLALFPALLALVFVYGLVFDRAQVEAQVGAMSGVLPEAAQKLIATELHQIVSSSGGALSVGVVISVLFALWSASRGMSGMMSGLDIAYGETEERSFIRFNLIALGLTLGLLVAGVIAIALVAVLPAVVAALQGGGAGGIVKWVALIVEWPILLGVIMVMLALLYRYAPDRRAPQWRWASPGAIIAGVLWIVGSILFSVYVANFGNYNATYGSLGAVVVLLTWLYLSAFVVLLGAEINAEIERQTKRDTTGDGDKPMGQRDAFAADTVGPSYDKG